MVGTIRYMSPERLAGAGYGVAADVWSLGLVLLEMAARSLPFDTTVSQIELYGMLEVSVVVIFVVVGGGGRGVGFGVGGGGVAVAVCECWWWCCRSWECC